MYFHYIFFKYSKSAKPESRAAVKTAIKETLFFCHTTIRTWIKLQPAYVHVEPQGPFLSVKVSLVKFGPADKESIGKSNIVGLSNLASRIIKMFDTVTKAEGIYHDQIDVLIARRPFL